MIQNVWKIGIGISYITSSQNWLSAVSVGRAKVEYAGAGAHPLPPGTLNKRSFLGHVPASVMENLLDEEPMIIATASEKFKNGKDRAIYGTSMVDYMTFGFVLGAIDPNMSRMDWCEMGRKGYERIADTLRRFYALRHPSAEGAMGDYADFNRQHMLRVLALRYAALREVCARKKICNSAYLKALD